MEEEVENSSTAVVLHEDKKYYPDADEVYPDAETMVQVIFLRQVLSFTFLVSSNYNCSCDVYQDEDTQPLEKPIIAPIRTKNFDHVEKKPPTNPYSTVYMHELCGVYFIHVQYKS